MTRTRTRARADRPVAGGVDVVYLAWNRLEFTRFTFETLLRNTDWSLVNRLVVYDDGSEDGTREWLRERIGSGVLVQEDAAGTITIPVELRQTNLGSPVAVMNDYAYGRHPAPWFVKLDSDVAVPDGWLGELVDVAARTPRLEILGMEAGWFGPPGHNGEKLPRRAVPCSHIGGVGLMQTSAFLLRPRPIVNGSRFGFTEWQSKYEPKRAWIAPDLPVGLLDRVPEEPWTTLSARYVAAGWQRPWGTYDPKHPWCWDWFDPDLVALASDGLR